MVFDSGFYEVKLKENCVLVLSIKLFSAWNLHHEFSMLRSVFAVRCGRLGVALEGGNVMEVGPPTRCDNQNTRRNIIFEAYYYINIITTVLNTGIFLYYKYLRHPETGSWPHSSTLPTSHSSLVLLYYIQQ